MPGKRKGIVASELAKLPTDKVEELKAFARTSRNTAEIRNHFRDLGYDFTQAQVQTWFLETFPVGEEAAQLNKSASRYQGVETFDALQFGLGLVVKQLAVIESELGQYNTIKAKAESGEPLTMTEEHYMKGGWQGFMMLLTPMLKELRAIAQGVNEYRYIRDRQELEIAGAQTAMQELLLIFADSPFEDALKEGIRGVMKKMEQK